ncbi:MAG: hypothetical protein HFJ26_10015 [Clostridia bacterium]|nr:hypothetical protein [Clostridia bacterium]
MSNQELIEVNTNELDTEISMLSNDNLLAMAEQAERRIEAIKRIMNASLKITNEKDWILIAGTPYLQESGATKVARLFGIGWKLIGEPILETESDGHFTYTYKAEFVMGNITIEATGSRSSKDDFFTGKTNPKAPQDIDKRDVKMSAYTNCINNGIKRILPGLRNLTAEDMQNAGLDCNKMQGYGFKGNSKNANTTVTGDFKCEHCKSDISSKVASYSKSQYGKELCMECQKLAKKGELDGNTGNEQQNKTTETKQN